MAGQSSSHAGAGEHQARQGKLTRHTTVVTTNMCSTLLIWLHLFPTAIAMSY